MLITSASFINVLRNQTSELLGGLKHQELQSRMTNERAIPFLNGKAMAAMFSWKGTEGIFFHIPAISKNQVFFMDFGNGNRQQNNTQFFKITGQSKTDDIWMAHGWLVQERTDCARKDTRYIRKQGVLGDCWVANGVRCLQRPFRERQEHLNAMISWVETMGIRGIEIQANPVGSIETIIEKGRDFQADQVFTSWIQPDGILVYLNDGLGLSKPKPGGRGNQRVRTRKPFRFPLPSITEGVKAEEIGDVVVVAAEARNEPETPDVPEVVEAEQPKNNEETVFRCQKQTDGDDMEIPDQYMLSNDKSDEQHHAVVRSITMSRILRSISPSEPVRVMCRYLKIFNRWEPIALVEDKV